jgi:hypothetical protein
MLQKYLSKSQLTSWQMTLLMTGLKEKQIECSKADNGHVRVQRKSRPETPSIGFHVLIGVCTIPKYASNASRRQ